jgi:GAF domain-containing protein
MTRAWAATSLTALTFVASWGRAVDYVPVGSRWSVGGRNIGTVVFETGRPARIDSYADASGQVGTTAREQGVRSSVATLLATAIANAKNRAALP